MKTSLATALFLSGMVAGYSQTTPSTPNNLPADTAYRVVHRSANQSVWQRETYEMSPDGQAVPKIHRYVEVASGLNYLDSNGVWKASEEWIESYPGGAIARLGQTKVIFANNLDSFGAIDVETPDHKRLRSNILGLMLHDLASDKAVLIAQVQDSQGQLISSNQVLYVDAFDGVSADVRYTYHKGSFHQDVILKGQLPSPTLYGMDPATTEVEVMTEFVDAPEATVSTNQADEQVSWGALRLGRGRAFDLGSGRDNRFGTPVAKKYVNIQGRHILLEKVRLQAMEATLSKLPQQSSVPKKSSVMLAGNLMLPKLPPARKTDRAMKLAMSTPPSKGYVLDYVTLAATVTNQTFQGDTTYYVSSYTSLSGGPFVIEGGTVIKFARGAALDFFSPFSCNTAPYRPAILTAVDDNSVGETISGSTGTPSGTYAYIAIAADGTSNLTPIENLHVKYADWGVAPYSSVGPDIVRNCQFVNNTVALLPQDNLAVENVLFDNVDTAFDSMGSGTVNATFVTAHHVNTLNNYCSLNVTNSLFVCVTNWGTSFSGAYNATNASDAGVFQPVGGGEHYLAVSSPYRDIGTTNISSTLLDDLGTKTTYPPIAYTNATFNTATTFSPQAERDTNTPDLGYHYDPLDYTFGGCTANSNLTFTAGTAVGWFRTTSGWYHAGHGIHVGDQQSVSFQGTATDPCYWVRLNTVQEQDKTAGYGPGGISSWINSTDVSHWPTMRMNWTKCSLMAGEGGGFFRDDWGYLIVRASDCEFSAGNAGGYGTSMDFTNCLLDRTYFANVSGAAGNEVVARNCTVHGGFIQMNTSTAFPISIQNCALDGTRLDLTGYAANSSYASYSYNAFTNSTNPFPFGGNNVVVTNFNWQTNQLGDFYLPSDSPLIDAGSMTADEAGLYEYTTQTNQTEEYNSPVDIGYHYVALDANGEPVTTLTNGIPDYIYDASGNGLPDDWELYWFGTESLSTTNLDTSGSTLLSDYLNGVTPANDISFSIHVTNNYVRSSEAPAQLEVSGIPYYMAVSLDDTNFMNDANWTLYTSTNISLGVGYTQGWHDVWVGLKGHAPDAGATWQWKRLKLDTSSPKITIISPTNCFVDVPMIQLAGYSPEELDHISCDVSNALGVFTNLDAGVTDRYHDATTWEFTTNYFECLDIELTNGVNVVAVHATDLAGNVTVTNFSFTLDYSNKTNPPVVQITWPQDSTKISGDSFTLDGFVNDPTVAVQAQIVSPDGTTNVVSGLVERSGRYWVENMPLASGANSLTLTVTDAVGNTTVTNLSVIQSTLTLAMNPVVPDSDLWKSKVNLTGVISDPNQAVWVNGVKGHNNGDGTWYANDVPTTPGGVASFTITAYEPDELQPDNSYGNP